TLYGTAKFGGLGGVGTIFKLNTDGTDFSVLKHFPSYRSDGALPTQSLTLDGDTLYGVTEAGGDPAGTPGHGVIFSLTLPRSSPQVQVTNPGFTGQSVSFGFQMAGPPGLGVVVEASTELTATNWVPLETNVLGTTPLQFLDKTATNYPRRYYRLRIQE
ncbi:MAG TPA: choice-of-anchor tandem repeat GloVer-containing protein, partial [Clostridia bacterium]|nr:choice-of-anchor tandem repeat GloVer-containing protein [Clostridia bacterium]